MTSSSPRIFTQPLVVLLSVALLTAEAGLSANAQSDANSQFPVADQFNLQEQRVVADDVTTNSYFGRSVTIDGSTAAISAFGDSGFQGAVYLFTKSNDVWNQGQKLTASDGLPGDRFGSSAALLGDTLVVGAPEAAINGASGQGAVYVFRNTGGSWTEIQKLLASDGTDDDDFGVAIALSRGTLVVGADGATINGHSLQGAAYVFAQVNGTWSQTKKLTGDDSVAFDHFGSAVAARGPAVLVGAPNKDISPNDFLTGEVYVFSRSNDSWAQTQKLIAEDSGLFANFGTSLALGRATAVIGAPHATANGHAAQGAAYLFTVSNGMLTQPQMVTSKDGANNDAFGSTVALAENQGGNRALVGAPFAHVSGSSQVGKAYVFGEADGTWGQIGTIVAMEGGMSVIFGFGVALERDTALVGSSPAAVPYEGAAYFYTAPAPVSQLP